MNKLFFYLYIFLFLFLLTGCSSSGSFSTIKVGNQTFQVELAKTPQQQYQGLSGRQSLPPKSGMLFVFKDYAVRYFTMRRMGFPLDIIWIKDDKVIGCEQNVPTLGNNGWVPQVSSPAEVNYVLEVAGGTCKKYGIQAGSEVEISQN